MVDFSGLRVQRLDVNAKLPTKSHCSAGYDLYTIHNYMLLPGERLCIPLGIATEMPYGYYGQIKDRSGLAAKEGLHVLGGVIDNDYRGEWKVVVLNTDPDNTIYIDGDDRIAQVVFMQYGHFEVNEVESLSETDRGAGAFGSTGR